MVGCTAVLGATGVPAAAQVSLFAITNETVVDQLRSIDIDTLSEQGAKSVLAEMKRKIV